MRLKKKNPLFQSQLYKENTRELAGAHNAQIKTEIPSSHLSIARVNLNAELLHQRTKNGHMHTPLGSIKRMMFITIFAETLY